MSFVQVPPDSTGKKIATNEVAGEQYQVVNLADSSGNAIAPLTDAQLRASPVITLIDSVATNQVSSGVDGTDFALTTHSIITGETTAGGGSYVNVKVNPSGALAVSVGDSALPAGAATETTLAAINGKLPTASAMLPGQDDLAMPVRATPQKFWDWSFARAISNGVSSDKATLLQTGSGMTVNQTGGNLVITSGTTANSETIIRSLEWWNGALAFSEVTTLSQRIANNNFYFELVDIIGDGLAYTIVTATTVDVTKAAHGFTAQNIGQRIDLCAITGAAGVPMEGVIASIPDANTIRFTVAGWPASGTGTLSLTGWNKIELQYTGTTATATNYNTRRQGYQNTSVAATTLTSASGHVLSVVKTDTAASLSDQLTTSAGVIRNRAAWRLNLPEQDTQLYLQIRAKNGTTAPATTTTWTVGMVRVEDYTAQQVEITATRQQSTYNALPVSGSVGITSGTVTAVTTLSNGQAAHDAVIAGRPHRIAGRAVTANYTAVASGDVADLITTTQGALVVKPFSIPEASWNYAAASGGITNTTAVTASAAPGAALRNYVTGFSIQNASATVATEVVILAGATTLWRGYLGTGALLNSAVGVQTVIPLRGGLNEAITVQAVTTGAAVYANLQGYIGT